MYAGIYHKCIVTFKQLNYKRLKSLQIAKNDFKKCIASRFEKINKEK